MTASTAWMIAGDEERRAYFLRRYDVGIMEGKEAVSYQPEMARGPTHLRRGQVKRGRDGCTRKQI